MKNANNKIVLDASKYRMQVAHTSFTRVAAALAFEAFEAPSAASRFLGGGFFRVDTALPIPAAGRPG